MDELFAVISPAEKEKLTVIAETAISLGYKVKKDAAKTLGYTFSHRKIKRRVLRFTLSRGKPVLKLSFFAAPEYSRYFDMAIKTVLEEFDFRYTGCYGCAKCDGSEGYRVTYPDGRSYFRCGSELIDLPDIENLPLTECLHLLRAQHEYYLRKAA